MRSRLLMNNRGWVGSAVLLGTLLVTASSLVAWKHAAARKADAAAASQPEPIESVTLAVARARQYRPTTTSVGTVLALNSITLRDRKSTRLNSSHTVISYAVFCLKKKKQNTKQTHHTPQATHTLMQY